MVIGIDASRAFIDERTGTENYSYELITQMLRLTTAKKHTFVLFIRPNAKIPKELDGYSNVIVKLINFPILWTQVGLAYETWVTKLDILWIPAHTLPVLRNRSIKTIVTIHGLEYKYLREYNNLLQRWYLPLSTYYAARRADRLICVSESTKRDLIAETGIDIEKTTVIYEGATIDRKSVNLPAQAGPLIRKSVLESYGIEKGRYILFVGTVQPRKNICALISAYAKVHKKHPDYKLVIAGGIGWDAEQDLAAPDKMGISDRVVFMGRVSPELLQVLYQGASVYVQPSWTEGFGLPALEAMASGVPVVVSSGGALPELVGDAGIIVSLEGGRRMFAARLASTVSSLLGYPERRELLKQRGLERVHQFSWKNAADKTLKYLTTG